MGRFSLFPGNERCRSTIFCQAADSVNAFRAGSITTAGAKGAQTLGSRGGCGLVFAPAQATWNIEHQYIRHRSSYRGSRRNPRSQGHRDTLDRLGLRRCCDGRTGPTSGSACATRAGRGPRYFSGCIRHLDESGCRVRAGQEQRVFPGAGRQWPQLRVVSCRERCVDLDAAEFA